MSLQAASAFIGWTGLSFGAHALAREVIKTAKSQTDLTVGDLWFTVLVLTLFQIGIGALVLLIAEKALSRRVEPAPLRPADGVTVPVILALTHFVATATTNAAIAFGDAGPAFVIKAFEPISSAVLTCILLGKKVEGHVLLALPIATVGAIGFVWQPESQISGLFGIVLAALSNTTFGLRNITLKQKLEESSGAAEHVRLLSRTSLQAGVALASLVLLFSPPHLAFFIRLGVGKLCVLSGLLHVSYTVLSVTVVLRVMSVVSHAAANLAKRIILAFGFYLLGVHTVGPWNAFFGVLFVLGLLIYSQPQRVKFISTAEQQTLCLAVIFALLFVALAALPPASFLPSGGAGERDVTFPPVVQRRVEYQNVVEFRTQRPALRETGIEVMQKTSSLKGSHPWASRYQTNLTKEMVAFLSVDINKEPGRADWLSKQLVHAADVVLEAERLHNMILGQITSGYKRAVLVNVFTWANRGDHLITIGERVLLRRFNLTLVYYCFYPGDDCVFNKSLQNPDTVVFIQGAGYIGHEAHLSVVEHTVTSFPRNRVIVFPISVCYPDKAHMSKYADVFKRHRDLYILLRDRPSYEVSQKYFTKAHLLLSPDAAFAVGVQHLTMVPTHDIIWVKRNDWENFGDDKHDKLPTLPKNMTAQIRDWDEEWMKQDVTDFMEDHQVKAMSAFVYLARGRVVITDRLHAHLMATLLGHPNVVVNSRTRKQQNYYDTWEKKIQTSYVVDSAQAALDKAVLLMQRYP